MNCAGQAARHRGSLTTALLAAVLGAGCTYPDDELLWGNCCALEVANEASSSKDRNTLISWGGTAGFHGDGSSQDWEGTKAWRKRQIAYGFAVFRERHPPAQARDYLAGLGMTCGDERDAKPDRTQCTAELSVWARCVGKLSMLFASPVPSGLRKPIAAVLRLTIDVSGSDILDSSVQVVPLAGGRLCQRQ